MLVYDEAQLDSCNTTDVKSYLFIAVDISVVSSPKHTLPPNNRSPP